MCVQILTDIEMLGLFSKNAMSTYVRILYICRKNTNRTVSFDKKPHQKSHHFTAEKALLHTTTV